MRGLLLWTLLSAGFWGCHADVADTVDTVSEHGEKVVKHVTNTVNNFLNSFWGSEEEKGPECLKEERKLPCLECFRGLEAASQQLHLQYQQWNTSHLVREGKSTQFQAKSSLGGVVYGDLDTGRKCKLERVAAEPPTHTFDVNDETLATTKVYLELQLYHLCESDSVLEKQVEESEDKIKKLKAEEKVFLEKLSKVTDTSEKSSPKEVKVTTKALHGNITELRDEVQQQKDSLADVKEAQKLKLPKKLVLVLPMTFDDSDVNKELQSFLEALLPDEDSKGPASFTVIDPAAMVAGSGTALMYPGTSLEAPCEENTQWIISTRVSKLAKEDFNAITRSMKKLHPEAGRDKQMPLEASGLKLLQLVKPEPKALPTANLEIEPTAVVIVGLLAFGALWHTLDPSEAITGIFAHSTGPLLVALAATGYGFFPGDLFSAEAYGFSFEVISDMDLTAVNVLVVLGCALSALLPAIFGLVVLATGLRTAGFSVWLLPSMLGIYTLLSSIQDVGSGWIWFVSTFPVASVLVRLGWRGIPLLQCAILVPWLTFSLGAFAQGVVKCTDDILWEVHLAFALAIVGRSMFWLAVSAQSSKLPRLRAFLYFVLVDVNTYSDAMCVAIATSCGTWHGTAALIAFAVGVVGLELALPSLLALTIGSPTAGVYNMVAFPVESSLRPKKKRIHEKSYVRIDVDPKNDPLKIDEDHLRKHVMLVAVLRGLCQNVPQSALQYLFLTEVKQVPFAFFSMGVSVCSLIISVLRLAAVAMRSSNSGDLALVLD